MHAADQRPRIPPDGVTNGAWEYVHSGRIAGQYDDYFAQNGLFEFDEQVLARHLVRPGLVVDLGCGTGRSLIPLLRRGFSALGVDLSAHMLQIAGEKADREGFGIMRLQANLVELGCVRDRVADYCICMFSTLGMIRGHENRRRMLQHAYRILKPGGLFLLHVHNLWYSLRDDRGCRWLARHMATSLLKSDVERGDKVFEYRGIRRMFLHTFTESELRRSLAEAKFRVKELIPLAAGRRRQLPRPWFLGRFRANGWIAVCEKPPEVAGAT